MALTFYWRGCLMVAVSVLIGGVYSLENGLALTPPMGWMTWQRFRCTLDCKKYPQECISENLVKRTADKMSSDGYLALGYEYLIVDDCWLSKNRGSNGELVADPVRFPSGMKALADYVHSKGLKFGIYEDYGTLTCAGYPGLEGHIKQDILQLVNWGIDYIKVDGCYHTGIHFEQDYAKLSDILNSTGRPIVYSCSYPAYQDDASTYFNFSLLAEKCNLWRNYDDIDDSWASVTNILDYFALKQEYITQFAGPGHWNDPDMLVIGNYGLSVDQAKVQMALWSIMAAPLLMSTDLDSIRPEFKAILQNSDVIAVNQDPLGIPGHRIYTANSIEVWRRHVTPVIGDDQSLALAFYSRRADGAPYEVTYQCENIGMTRDAGYIITDLYKGTEYDRTYFPNSNITVRINPTGVIFLKATVRA